ncbi:hypothetical protein BJ508DRAFT_412251 [Ascobolus immersus RN42]|uniref:Uncharacterized protein n=1 Tax=Ascobolus immersus RN42 TaxID=1160509 RepID=A0A3N4IU41_ASCIM|nr:hypothetical protein BJ508DRAFT_412251 [Ascobolus immersus RN42]
MASVKQSHPFTSASPSQIPSSAIEADPRPAARFHQQNTTSYYILLGFVISIFTLYPWIYLAPLVPLANAHINAFAKQHAKPTGEAILHWIWHFRQDYYDALEQGIWVGCWMGLVGAMLLAWSVVVVVVGRVLL